MNEITNTARQILATLENEQARRGAIARMSDADLNALIADAVAEHERRRR